MTPDRQSVRQQGEGMNESEWLVSEDAHSMLDYLRRQHRVHRTMIGKRKLRLFVCACFRSVWQLLPGPRSRTAVEVGERLADGTATDDEVQAAYREASLARPFRWPTTSKAFANHPAAHHQPAIPSLGHGVLYCLDHVPWGAVEKVSALLVALARLTEVPVPSAAPEFRAGLVRDLFGNPFRPVCPDVEWLTANRGIVPKMARAIHDAHSFEDLPVLADALEEAGCYDPAILAHCRAGGLHARGCWVVDTLLGRH